jgi:hypothetical protein
MTKLSDDVCQQLDSVDQKMIQTVVETYRARRASGVSEFAAQHAALIVLREHLPNWPVRVAADMVRRIINLAGRPHPPA